MCKQDHSVLFKIITLNEKHYCCCAVATGETTTPIFFARDGLQLLLQCSGAD